MKLDMLPVALFAGVVLGGAAGAHAQPLYGIMFRTGGQTSGLMPTLYDVSPATGAATNPRSVNVNDCVGIAVSPAGVMFGLTDQLGRINNVSGTGGKGLVFTIDPVTGAARAVGRLDPTSSASDAPLAVFEGDLAFQPGTGVLYGVTQRVNFARLFTVNTTTGLGTIVADILPPSVVPIDPTTQTRTFDISAMSFSPQGDLWVLDTTYPTSPGPAKLYRVDPASGAVLEAIVTSTNLGNCAGMAFKPNGELYVADGDTSGTANLYRMNFATGNLDLVGATGARGGTTTVYTGLAGLAFGPGGSAGCNIADITGIGGPPSVPDGLLTGDDFNAFVSAFAAGDPLADVTGIGGPPATPDGLVTGDDFNAFVSAFAAGCP